MSDNRRFRRGSGVFKCSLCGKLTRETGRSNSFVEMCPFCMEASEQYNLVQDEVISYDEFKNKVIPNLKKQYNRSDDVEKFF